MCLLSCEVQACIRYQGIILCGRGNGHTTLHSPAAFCPICPGESTDGAPQTSVLVAGSSNRGKVRSSTAGITPRGGRLAASAWSFMAAATPRGIAAVCRDVVFAPAVTMLELAPPPIIVSSGDVIPEVVLAPPGWAKARASSSRSSNVSCLTALMEYAQMPVATPKTEIPRMAFFTRYGARARFKPGDMTYVGRLVSAYWPPHETHAYITLWPP